MDQGQIGLKFFEKSKNVLSFICLALCFHFVQNEKKYRAYFLTMWKKRISSTKISIIKNDHKNDSDIGLPAEGNR